MLVAMPVALFRFAEQFGYQNFEANNGFLQRFTLRKGLVSKKAAGESASVNRIKTDNYAKNVLPTLLERYNPEDIYNVNETGLFCKLLPE